MNLQYFRKKTLTIKMPRTRYLQQTIREFIDRINSVEGIAPQDTISISLSTVFNRGNEENGVWSRNMKRDYINSIFSGFPCGQICLVRDYGNAMNGYSSPSLILDGANKSRALRDFIADRFTIPYGPEGQEVNTLFSSLPEDVKANFMATQLSISRTEVTRNDPTSSIATMFTRLNTRQVPLSQGELIKAYSWLKNLTIPELAKHIIGGEMWAPHISQGLTQGEPYNRCSAINNNMHQITALKTQWANSPLGELGERARLDNIALLCGMIIAIQQNNIYYYDKRFDRLEEHLGAELNAQQVRNIIEDLSLFVSVMTNCYHNSIFGSTQKGMPSKKFTVYIMEPIVNSDLTDTERNLELNRLSTYFTYIRSDLNALTRFRQICSSGGNNEVAQSKFAMVRQEVNDYITNEEMALSSEEE